MMSCGSGFGWDFSDSVIMSVIFGVAGEKIKDQLDHQKKGGVIKINLPLFIFLILY